MKVTAIEAIPLRIGVRQTLRFGTVDRKQSQNVVVRSDGEETTKTHRHQELMNLGVCVSWW